MVLNRNGLFGVIALCGVACGDGGGADDAEPAATLALETGTEPDVALVDEGEDLSGQWSGWNGWNGRGARPNTPNAPGGGAWDPTSVAQWCFLLGDRQAEFLCKVTFADCERPSDPFTQILCQLRGFGGGNTPRPPAGGNNPPPRDDGDAWGDDLVDVDGDNGSDEDGSWDDDDDDEGGSGAPGLGG